MVLEELGADDQLGRHVLALRPQRALVDEHLAPALLHQARGPRFRDPRAVELALLEQVQGLGVVLGHDRDVAAAGGVGLEALLLQPGAQGDVLGVAQLGRRDLLALEVLGALDAGLHDKERAARRRARDDPDRLAARLRVRVDGGVRPDVGGVQRARVQRLYGLGAGVERARLELRVVAELLLEDAALDADDRRGVGDVGEVAEPERDVPLLRRRPGAGRGEEPDRGGGDDREHRQAGEPAGDVHRGEPPRRGMEEESP